MRAQSVFRLEPTLKTFSFIFKSKRQSENYKSNVVKLFGEKMDDKFGDYTLFGENGLIACGRENWTNELRRFWR